ncbi:MAG: leucine-rich repeat protein [Lachnospiraceae bacterium]|nr:leucine-rich repeat protein [Lachnospiraceae bacterium]
MKRWNRILSALLAATMFLVPWSAIAEPALDIDMPEADGGVMLETVPEEAGDAKLVLDDALAIDGLDIEDIDMEQAMAEDAVVGEGEAEAANSVSSNYNSYEFDIDENGVLVKYRGYGSDVVIPDGVTRVGDSAFEDCGLLRVTIPNSVTSIGDSAFKDCCLLDKVTIPNSVTSIGEYAFYGCEGLTSVTIGNSVTSIGRYAFYYCFTLKNVTIPDSVTSIEEHAFDLCYSLTSVTIGNNVTSIGEYAFGQCYDLTSVTIPDSVTSIGGWAFSDCEGLTNVTIPKSVSIVGRYAFSGCESLTSVTIPNGVTSIGDGAFSSCEKLKEIYVSGNNPCYASINGVLYSRDMRTLIQCPGAKNSVTIPNSVTSIGESAFNACFSLTSVTIPNSVTSIGQRAFAYCDSLASVIIFAKSIYIDEDAFKNSDPTFYIIEGSKAIDWAIVNNYDYDTFVDGLSKKSLKLEAGETRRLTVYVQGKETTDVTWSSSNKKIATVKAGTVTAIKDGTCTITAKVKNGETLTCDVTVREAARLNKTKLSMKPGDTQTLRISGLHSRKVTWTSSDKKVATVKDGKVTALYVGKCTITAQIKDGKKLTCRVTVTDEARLSRTKLTISNIDSDRIKLIGGLNRKVTWSTSNKNVVEITKSDNESASIKAGKNGTATITAKIAGGKTLKCAVTVVDPLTIKVDYTDEESVYNELWVYFINHSNKKITYVTLDIAQYNNRGDKLKSPYDYYYLNENVWPHDDLHHYYWVNDDTKKVKIRITEVTFADKTTWRP